MMSHLMVWRKQSKSRSMVRYTNKSPEIKEGAMSLKPTLNKSTQQPMRVERSAKKGVFRVKNAYSGKDEYFKGRPLRR